MSSTTKSEITMKLLMDDKNPKEVKNIITSTDRSATMSSSTTKSKITMKLLIDKNKRKVLFGEAGKESVDFFLHILTYPLGTVVSYLNKESMAGSVGNLYGSFESLGTEYVRDSLNKDCLLHPKTPFGVSPQIPLLTENGPARNSVTFYGCNEHMNVSDAPGARCPKCIKSVNHELTYLSPEDKKAAQGYVKGVVTYMITDDLSVQPMSMITSIAVLNRFGVERVSGLEEREVTLDENLAAALLKASLMSKTVLTDVFLSKKEVDFPGFE